MKKFLYILMIGLLLLSMNSIAVADGESAEPLSFARNYTVTNVNDTAKQIMRDINVFSEQHITCTWTSSSGPTAIKVYCEIKLDGAWSSYGSETLTAVDQTASFTIKGGEEFRLRVKRASGNYGDCKFGVTLI